MIYVLFEQLQHETFFVCGVEVAYVVFEELFQHRRFEGRDSDHVLDGEQYANRDRDKIGFVFGGGIFVFDRCVDEHETHISVPLVAGAFVEVEGVGQESGVEIETASELIQLVGRKGRGQVYPAARLWLGQFDQAAFFSYVITGHCPWVGFYSGDANFAAQTYVAHLM